jgi:hypothetical protein
VRATPVFSTTITAAAACNSRETALAPIDSSAREKSVAFAMLMLYEMMGSFVMSHDGFFNDIPLRVRIHTKSTTPAA